MHRTLIPFLSLAVACGTVQPEPAPPHPKEPAHPIEEGLEKAGEAVEEGARTAGDVVENGAKNVAGELDDVTLSTAVKSALAADPELHAAGIRVRSENGVVSLSGTVPNLGEKMRATSVASRVDGVSRVENGLELGG